jgi:hypothetical protein
LWENVKLAAVACASMRGCVLRNANSSDVPLAAIADLVQVTNIVAGCFLGLAV